MPATITGRTRPTKVKKQANAQKRKREDVDVEKLEQAVVDLDLKSSNIKDFNNLPLSEPTKAGLKACQFTVLTDIQAKAIPLALKGEDILGAAKTGSGKTLAFIIPVLENLYRKQCVGPDAGLGAMIISPTRELAIQIFDVLYKIGRKGHMFAAGLVIGGKSLKDERDALLRMNIVVCTPGRMLQHLSQTAMFSVDSLQMLVLDEADRILDMGFQRDVDAIIDYLPKERQTLLFSATQTKKLSDLARLSLNEPEYIAVHEAAATATPKGLQQNYTVVPLPEKLDTLWSFIQASKTSKTVVFLSSGKQVRFVYESFRKMQPGIPLLHLYGRQKQTARLDIMKKFSSSKTSCLFATDIAARGLDFPAVDWVVQVDCPEDADTYIHRVGRTARYGKEGRAVLFLDPSEEEGMLKHLEQKKVPVEKINVKAKKQQSIKDQIQHLCFKDPSLKYLAEKSFKSYARSIHVQRDKEIFQLKKLDLKGYSASLGLLGPPSIRFREGQDPKALKNASRQAISESESEVEEEEEGSGNEALAVPNGATNTKFKQEGVRTKYDRMFERRNQDVLSTHYSKLIRDDNAPGGQALNSDGEDDFLSVKRRIPAEPESDLQPTNDNLPAFDEEGRRIVHLSGMANPLLVDSKRREKLLTSKKKLLKLKDKGTRILFDDEGNAQPVYRLEDEKTFTAQGDADTLRQTFLEGEREKREVEDVGDKALAREKKRAKREKKKEREREQELADEEGSDGGVELENGDVDAFANFLADARAMEEEDDRDDDDRDNEDSEERSPSPDEVEEQGEQPQPKRQKKWFEKDDDDSDEEEGASTKTKGKKSKSKSKVSKHRAVKEVDTFEDLEAMAAGLLG